jgi:hypothetical protein
MTDFEAYLLAQMRAKELVASTLAKEGLSPRDLETKARQAALRWSLDQPGCDARNYAEAIGRPPVSERALSSAETAPVFAGSIRRTYRLDLWPEVLFCVNQHPSGYAWGQGFVQDQAPGRFLDPAEAKPWEWVSEAIESQASHVEVIEHWEHQKDLRVVFSECGLTQTYFARFDFNLLQEWTREQS